MSNTDKKVNRWSSNANRRGSKAKRISELSPSTKQRYVNLGKLPYFPMFRDTVRDLFEFPLSNSARLTWLRLQPYFANRLSTGFLLDERTGWPITSDFLAAAWHKDKSELDRDLEELTKLTFIGEEGGVLMDFAMVSGINELDENKGAELEKLESEKEIKMNNWGGLRQGAGRNCKKPRANDLTDGPQQSPNKLSQSRVEKSRVEESNDSTLLSNTEHRVAASAPHATTLASDGKIGAGFPSAPPLRGADEKALLSDGKSAGPVPSEPESARAEPTVPHNFPQIDANMVFVRQHADVFGMLPRTLHCKGSTAWLAERCPGVTASHLYAAEKLGLVVMKEVRFDDRYYAGSDWLRDNPDWWPMFGIKIGYKPSPGAE